MPVHKEFAYRMARLLVLNEPDPFTSWKLVPLNISIDRLTPTSLYLEDWEAFAPASIGAWSIQMYLPPGTPPPPEEVLPYAYLENPPLPWLNTTDDDIVVRATGVTAWNSALATPARQLLFWSRIVTRAWDGEEWIATPVTPTVEPGQTFEVQSLRFEIVELADL